jgi:serine/threonine protein kinase
MTTHFVHTYLTCQTRDLKPENLLLDDDFRLKLTDFGTGKILSAGVERSKTWVGTAQYISPELLESSETSKRFDYNHLPFSYQVTSLAVLIFGHWDVSFFRWFRAVLLSRAFLSI